MVGVLSGGGTLAAAEFELTPEEWAEAAFALLTLPGTAFPDGESLRRFGDRFFAQVARARGGLPGHAPGAISRE